MVKFISRLSKKLIKHIFAAICIFFIVVLLGSAVVVYLEDMDFIDAFYMTMMTATTIGYGDVTPSTKYGKLFISFYSLLGVGTFLYIFAIIAVTNVDKYTGQHGVGVTSVLK
jgi:voltage-gated potassium channel